MTSVSDGVQVSVLNSLRSWGWPNKRKIRNFLEGLRKTRIAHKCRCCDLWGHYKSTHKNPLHVENEEIYQSTKPSNNLVAPITVRAKLPIWRADASELA